MCAILVGRSSKNLATYVGDLDEAADVENDGSESTAKEELQIQSSSQCMQARVSRVYLSLPDEF